MKVAVTGSSGFVGGAIAKRLAAKGDEVTGFSRTRGAWTGEHRHWDISRGALQPEQFDVVVHCAALADDWATLDHARRINVDGSRAVIASFPGARIVHLSTSSVYDAFSPTVDVRETARPATRFLSSYSETKAEAESLFAGLDAVVLRPHAVYGEGDTTLVPRVLAAVRGGRLVLPRGGRVLHTLTHIDNLANAVELAAGASFRGILNVGDDGAIRLDHMIRAALNSSGRSDVTITAIPYATAFAAAAALETLARVRGSRPRLTRYAVSQLGLERTLDITAAREQLGYVPTPTILPGAV